MAGASGSVCLVMTFHSEGLLAYKSLRAAGRALLVARDSGIGTELVAVLDRATAETCRAVRESGVPTLCVHSDAGDAGEARNAGIASSSSEWVGICDGDDYVSENWLSEAVSLAQGLEPCVLHPEYLVSFGAEESYTKLPDMRLEAMPESCLLSYNPWPSCVVARRSTFLEVPYEGTRAGATGFGFEDWHWTCETVAAGYRHATVPGTAYFYRRSPSGRLARESTAAAILRPSRLFARDVPVAA